MLHPSLREHRLRFALCVLFAFRTMAVSQILDVRDLNVDEIRSLDRQRTAVILPGSILEEHGPYLPLYTDGWIKDADLNTAFGNTVEPLPFHAIRKYPYAPGEAYPTDSAHQRYRREYNSRVVKRH